MKYHECLLPNTADNTWTDGRQREFVERENEDRLAVDRGQTRNERQPGSSILEGKCIKRDSERTGERNGEKKISTIVRGSTYELKRTSGRVNGTMKIG